MVAINPRLSEGEMASDWGLLEPSSRGEGERRGNDGLSAGKFGIIGMVKQITSW
jgi:hypothetical protein